MKNKVLLYANLLIITGIGNLFAQNTFSISSATQLVTSGTVTIDYGGGTLTNNGSFASTTGTLAFSGPVTFEGSGTTNTKDLKVAHSGTSILNNRINVLGTLDVNNGNLNANNNLTLVSNAAGSAVIAAVPSGSNITGKVTVQRYIPLGKRAFRFFAPSVTTDNFISNNWQLATHITGSTSGANGFDATISGNPSLFTYNNTQSSGSGWAAVPNTNATNLSVTQGYRLLVRGDRTVNISVASEANMNNPITLSATGTVATGDVVFNSGSTTPVNGTTNTTTDGFSLIPNPYVNTVNWNTLVKTGLTDAYYTWDANMGSLAQRGRYVAFSTATGTSNNAFTPNQFIQPGQAFFIKNAVLGTAGSLTFSESNKTGIANVNNFYRTASNLITRLDLHVFETSELSPGAYPLDAAVCVFDNQFTNAIQTGDVVKLSTGVENISFLNGGTLLSIDARALVTATDEVLVQLQQFLANKGYTFRAKFNNFDASATPFLVDSYLNQNTALANNGTTDVAFTTTADVASYSTDRFKIVFQNTTLSNPIFNSSQITLFPNPVVGNQFNIALPSYLTGNVTIKVINIVGQIVYETTAEAQKTITVTTNKTLPKALYIVQIENQGATVTKKITVE
jgi:hypothetical protein